MLEGWVKTYRKIREWQHYQEPTVVLVWLDLLISANSKDGWYHGHRLHKGEFFTSVATIQEHTGLDAKTIRKALDKLEATGEIKREANNVGSKITINQFIKYQGSGNNPQPTPQRVPQPNPQPTPQRVPYQQEYKEGKEREEEKNINIPSPNARAREIGIETFGSFSNVYLHPVEHRTLVMNYGKELTEKAVDDLSCKIAEGDEQANSSLNHYATLDRWLRYKTEKGAKAPMSSNPSATETEEQKCRRIWSMMKKEDQEQHLKENDGLYPWEDPRYNKSLKQQEYENAK